MADNNCIHCIGVTENALSERIAFCDLSAEWMNIDLGDCFGNCEDQEVDDNG